MKDTNSKGYFCCLTGAKKNVGDFLITDRALSLLKTNLPGFEFLILPNWKILPDLELVNGSKGIIILGGPGFQMNMYPGVYKLVSDLELIKVPIFTLGVGWKGIPGDGVTEKLYLFNKSTHILLKKLNKSCAGMSCRDLPTKRVLNKNGYDNVTMTGCPAWYCRNSIGKRFQKPEEIRQLVYTPAQSHFYSNQSIEVLYYLKTKYSNAQIIVSFHRGLRQTDDYTSEYDAINTNKIAQAAEKIGAKILDVSYDISKLSFYDECDLHIGYRVHAHIYFLSKRLPSILLHEDGRGNGLTETLQSPGVNGYRISFRFAYMFGLFKKNRRILSLYRNIFMKLNPQITKELDELIHNIELSNYTVFDNISNYIDNHYQVMQKYILSMADDNKEE